MRYELILFPSESLTVFFSDRRKIAYDTAAISHQPTPQQLATLQERSNRLRRQFEAWTKIQSLYMPSAAVLRDQAARAIPDGVPQVKVEDLALWLPSALEGRMPCRFALKEFEWRLREGQAYDALHNVRQGLRLRSYLYKYKDQFVRGVHHNTRAKTTIDRVQAKINHAATRYRVAREALEHLSPGLKKEEWRNALKVLSPDDVRGMSESLFGETEGTRVASWIWRSSGVMADPEDVQFNDGMLPSCMFIQLIEHVAHSCTY